MRSDWSSRFWFREIFFFFSLNIINDYSTTHLYEGGNEGGVTEYVRLSLRRDDFKDYLNDIRKDGKCH